VKTLVIEEGANSGLGSIILAGINIGSCSQIGAGSVVRKSVHEDMIAAGVPEKVL
jgi:maltose O-acetyltransferase